MLDVALVLDVSGSVDEVYGLVIDLARRTISGLPVGGPAGGVRMAVVTFSDVANVTIYLDSYTTTSDLLNALVVRRPGVWVTLMVYLAQYTDPIHSSRLANKPAVTDRAFSQSFAIMSVVCGSVHCG